MAVVVQLAGVKTSLDLVPDGVYPANLTKTTFGMSKSNQPKVDLEFVFEADAGEDGAVGGRKAFVTCSLQPQALFKVKKTLIDLGTDPDDLEGPVDLEEAFGELMGSQAYIRVGHHEYNNSEHNDFYVVEPPDGWDGQ